MFEMLTYSTIHGKDENCIQNFIGKLEGKRPLEDLDIGGRIILECIFGKYGGKMWTRCVWLRIGTSSGLL
jgi:hypothetical protein